MVYFRVNLSDGKWIRIGEDELKIVVEALKKRTPVIQVREGIFNSAFYTSIGVDRDTMNEIQEMKKYGKEFKEFPSPFARILSEVNPMRLN